MKFRNNGKKLINNFYFNWRYHKKTLFAQALFLFCANVITTNATLVSGIPAGTVVSMPGNNFFVAA